MYQKIDSLVAMCIMASILLICASFNLDKIKTNNKQLEQQLYEAQVEISYQKFKYESLQKIYDKLDKCNDEVVIEPKPFGRK